MLSTSRVLGVALAACVLSAGCAGGSGGSSGATPARTGGSAAQSVLVRITVPAATHGTNATKRDPRFVSPSTNGVLVNAYAATDTTHQTVLGTTAVDVSSGSPACGGTTGTPRTCTVPIPAPAGNDTLVFTSYDAPPSGGSFAGAKALGSGSVTQAITLGQSNAVNVTLGGIVSSVSVSLPIPNIHGTVSSQQRLTVAALDAGGNVIVSDPYVDANGKPVTIAIGAAPNPNNEIVLNATTLSAPSSGVTVTYDGTATAAYASTLTATPSNGIPAASTTLTLIGPKETVFPIPGTTPFPFGITAGPDGNVWFTMLSASKIGRITPSGIMTLFQPPNCPCDLEGIVSGPLGDLWSADNVNGLQLTVPGTGVSTVQNAGSPGKRPTGIAVGSDGGVWYTEESGNSIGRLYPGIGETTFPLPVAGGSPLGIAAGPDGNLWFCELTGNKIGRITTTGTITEFPLPHPLSDPAYITAGPDGNLWFTEQGASRVGRITPAGVITEFTPPDPRFSVSIGITAGPDGNVWFTEQGPNALGRIGRITPGGVITEYNVSMSNSLELITVGPDGNLWYTDQDNGTAKLGPQQPQTIRKFVW
jgi:streptogramin lyase